MTTITGTELEEPDIETLQRKLEAVSFELRNTQLDLMDANDDLMDVKDDLESTQAERDTTLSSLTETQLELQNTKDALANSERAHRTALSSLTETQLELQKARDALASSEHARREANQNRVMSRPRKDQEVFVVLKFQKPQELPIGGFRIFTQQRKIIDRTLSQFFANNPKLDAIEVEELRFDHSPRGGNVIQHMRLDKNAPIKITNRNFVLKDHKTEDEMIEYITKVFNTHTQENSTASTVQ
ncbi:hypothetical protein BGZ80_010561 [Entomortierella chlamydospora]|uniref:Uncharacterized protein n=1 Tax=Entomortierella chlamydospora TaxID=101097 RepID=A0A9P6SZN2_9FUNG|nr:hypothetical protein BGZ79_002028 [Entomortierella chlamydospora]KAG0014242.1 hypothetical protein BGZ80_010558 [Entomortierella chlamydospora]KAG0014245.1 hypothetical protein BGZ80_010561 [Entomortierella chlamydospora]